MTNSISFTFPLNVLVYTNLVLSRIRIGLTRDFSENFKGKISAQDIGAIDWGFQDSDWSSSALGGLEKNPARLDFLDSLKSEQAGSIFKQ